VTTYGQLRSRRPRNAKHLAALIALAKAKPDGLSIAIGGIGSSLHLAGEQLS
jgi:tripartite-type tricarboxylate transporter receptor subunit TctC